MQADIHPEFKKITISCACGAKFVTMSTKDDYQIDVCSACHPFYTGAQKFIDSAGRVEKFQSKFKSWDAVKANEEAKAAKKKKPAAAAPAPKAAAPAHAHAPKAAPVPKAAVAAAAAAPAPKA
jgi:large subunit ribosomal protein L31